MTKISTLLRAINKHQHEAYTELKASALAKEAIVLTASYYTGSVVVAKAGIVAGLGASLGVLVAGTIGLGYMTMKKDFKDNTVYRHNTPMKDITPSN